MPEPPILFSVVTTLQSQIVLPEGFHEESCSGGFGVWVTVCWARKQRCFGVRQTLARFWVQESKEWADFCGFQKLGLGGRDSVSLMLSLCSNKGCYRDGQSSNGQVAIAEEWWMSRPRLRIMLVHKK